MGDLSLAAELRAIADLLAVSGAPRRRRRWESPDD